VAVCGEAGIACTETVNRPNLALKQSVYAPGPHMHARMGHRRLYQSEPLSVCLSVCVCTWGIPHFLRPIPFMARPDVLALGLSVCLSVCVCTA
jgi:hypothetical protein